MSESTLLTTLRQKLLWQQKKSQIHSHNIAHAETPGFQGKRLIAFDHVLRQAQGGSLSGFQHNGPIHQLKEALDRSPLLAQGEVKRDIESMEMAENSLMHQANTHLYKKYLGLLKMAIGRGSS